MVQGKSTVKGIYAILGMSAITALLIVGSGHVSIPFAYKSFDYGYDDYAKYNYNKYNDDHDDDDDDDDDDDGKSRDKYNYQPKPYSKPSYQPQPHYSQTYQPKPYYQQTYQPQPYYQQQPTPSYQPSYQPHNVSILTQEAVNICVSNIADKNKIKIEAKDGAVVEILCLISQTQTLGPVDPVMIQDAANKCVSNIDGKTVIKSKGNKIEIKAKDGTKIKIVCTITQMQNLQGTAGFLSQDATNICGSNIGAKNKLEIKAKDGSAVIIKCQIDQTQNQMMPMQSPPVDPIQDSVNICGSNIGHKNKIKLEAKDGSVIVISCENNQTQSIGTDPFLIQESTNVCATNIGDKNSLKIKAKDGSAVIISCENNQMQSIGMTD